MPYINIDNKKLKNNGLHTGLNITPSNVNKKTSSLHNQALQLVHPTVTHNAKIPGDININTKAALSNNGKVDTAISLGKKDILGSGLSLKLFKDNTHIKNNGMLTNNGVEMSLGNHIILNATNEQINGNIINKKRNLNYTNGNYSIGLGKDNHTKSILLNYKNDKGLSGYLIGEKPISTKDTNIKFGVNYDF